MSTYLFKNAHIIDPVTGLDTEKDLFIVDGVIESISEKITSVAAETFDLKGKIISPGLCDMHVHLREPGYEYKETIATGALAAAAGGFTAVACMPNTDPAIDSAETVMYIKRKSENLPVDIYPIGAVTKGREGKEISPMAELFEAGVVAFSDDGNPVFNTNLLRIAFEYSSMFNVPIIQHAEDPFLSAGGVMNEGFTSTQLGLPGIPTIAEDIIVRRDIALAEYLDCSYHVAHVSTSGAATAIRQAKERGLKVTCEVTPHHLSLTEEIVRDYESDSKVNPPLRTMDDIIALKEALRDSVIDAIATDHAPHAIFEKEVEYIDAPFGIIGLETALAICITELVKTDYLTIKDLIEKLSTNPRRILRLPEIRIAPGEKANITIFDTNQVWQVDRTQLKSKSKNTPYHGYPFTGRPLGIFNNDQLVWVA